MHPATLVRKAAKTAALPLGIMGRRRHGDLVVLLYHRVGAGEREIDLPTTAFERQVAALAESEQVLHMDQAVPGPSPGGVVVTFDDGSPDFHEHVLPALVRHGVPALLYLATGLVANGGGARGEGLSWAQLSEATSTGLVTVGSHTHGHSDLSEASESEALEEMRRSKELIEDRLGTACRHFAYPWGRASRGSETAARRLFDSSALGWGTNRAPIDPHRLDRIPLLRTDGGFFFRAKVRGMLDAEAHLYRLLRRGPWRKP